jgi:DNA-binding transcriptional regulator YiaG
MKFSEDDYMSITEFPIESSDIEWRGKLEFFKGKEIKSVRLKVRLSKRVFEQLFAMPEMSVVIYYVPIDAKRA